MAPRDIALLVVAAFAAASGQVLFRVGANAAQHWRDYVNLPIASGLLLYGLGTMIWIYSLSTQRLVQVYPFTALTFVCVYAASHFLLGETLTLVGLVGATLVLIGLYCMTL